MGLFRVPVMMTNVTYGYVEIEADDENEAIDEAMKIDRLDLQQDAEWGSCGDETTVEVLYEDDVENITPPSASDALWV